MKKNLFTMLGFILSIMLILTFSVAGCKKEAIVETTTAVTTAAAQHQKKLK